MEDCGLLELREEEESEGEEDEEDWRLPSAVTPSNQVAPKATSLNPGAGQFAVNQSASTSSDVRVSSMELNVHKAGMEGLDKERINKIIMEASKGSRFFENQKKREQQTGERIDRMMEARAKLTNAQKQAALVQMDAMAQQLEAGRDMTRCIVHLDMDMFYAAVEMRDDPTLRDKPMAVGGMGMLSTSNYKARRFGVRAAMPGFIGKKLCPQLVIVPPHFDKYRAVSREVRAILAEYDPNFCPMSLDEAYFDLTNHLVKRRDMSEEQRTFPYRSTTIENNGKMQCSSSDLTDKISSDSEPNVLNSDYDLNNKINTDSDWNNKISSDQTTESSYEDKGEVSCDHRASKKSSDKNVKPGRHYCEVMQQSVSNSAKQACLPDSDIHPQRDTVACIDGEGHSGMSEDEEYEEWKSIQPLEQHLKENRGSMQKEEGIMKADGGNKNDDEAGVKEAGQSMIEEGCNGMAGESKRCETFGLTCEEAVREIRFRIEQRTQLTASAGIAPNCMLAKICSDKNKPNGQYRIQPTREAVMEFIKDLPIRKISGIGKVTERMLSALGVQTCTDLYQERALLHLLFSPTSSSHFLRISLGLGSTHVERDGERKSISNERTFREISSPSELYSKCQELCESLAEELKEEQVIGKTVTIKLKTVNFDVKSRSTSLKAPIRSATEIYAVAKSLLATEIRACHPQPLRLRLMGVRLSALQDSSKAPKTRQGSLLDLFQKKQTSKCSQQSQHGTLPTLNHTQSGDSSAPPKSAEATSVSTEIHRVDAIRTCGESCDTPLVPVSASTSESLHRMHPELNSAGQGERGESSSMFVQESDREMHLSSIHPAIVMDTDHPEMSGSHPLGAERTNGDSAYQTDTSKRTILPTFEAEVHADESTQLQERIGNDFAESDEGCSTPDVSIKSDAQSNVNSEPGQSFTCPICGVEGEYRSLDDFNQHIDVCLNKSAIEEILKKDVPGSSTLSEVNKKSSPKKASKMKRSHPGSSSSSKKRKSDQGHSRTLHHFFQNQEKR